MMKILNVAVCFCLIIGFVPVNKAAAFSMNDISAGSAVVIELESGKVILEKNAYSKRQMASTTKIMSTLLTLESGELDKKFTVDSEAIKVEGSSMGLCEGDIVTKRDLCYGMMLPSGNDAANAAAVKVAGSVESFVSLMNKRAGEIGLENTHFVTPSGLDDDTDEHYSTAYDMAMLTRHALQNEDFAKICSEQAVCLEYGNPPYKRWLYNSNKLLGNCEGVKGVKTGFTDKAGRCLVSFCERDGVKLICVTLSAPNDWQDHKRMYNYAFSQLCNIELPCDYYGFCLDVVGGEKSGIMCSVNDKPRATVYLTQADKITCDVMLPKFVYAPVSQGEKVGQICFYCGDELISTADITAREFVKAQEPEKKSIFDKIKDKFVFE